MGKTVMVVDDIPFARRVIKEILSAAKYTVVAEAENGAQAVELFSKHKPELVTMDIVMPKKGGIEATREIMEVEKSAKVIIVSAMAHESLLMDAVNAGVRDYILKPFQPEDLLRAVEKVLTEDNKEDLLNG